MRSIVIALAVVLILPCYGYSASLDEGMEDIKCLYSEEDYDFEVLQDAPCRQWEAFLILGSVGILEMCILFPNPESCSLIQVAFGIAFYFYYIDCLPREPAP